MKTLLTILLLISPMAIMAAQPRVGGVEVMQANGGVNTNGSFHGTVTNYGKIESVGTVYVGSFARTFWGDDTGSALLAAYTNDVQAKLALITYRHQSGTTNTFLTFDLEAGGLGEMEFKTREGSSDGTFLIQINPGEARHYLKIDGLVYADVFPSVADGASAIAYQFATLNTLANASARLLSVQNPLGTEKVGFLANGNVTIPGTLNVGALFSTNAPVNLAYTTTNLLLDATLGATFRVLATNNFGIRLTNGFDGQEVILECYQDSVGFRTGVLVNNTGGTQTNLLKSGSDITGMALSTNGVTKDILKFKFTAAFGGKTNQWDLIGNLRGY
jgi:hypothetical protein